MVDYILSYLLDVHEKCTHVATWLNGRLEITFVMPALNKRGRDAREA